MQIRKDIPSKMYHYTSLESLCSIVENQEFWLGDTRQMNDYNEALELLNILNSLLNEDADLRDDPQCRDVILSINRNTLLKTPIYVACFTKLADDAAQWERYANNAAGVAIEFDVAKFERAMQFNSQMLRCITYIQGDVVKEEIAHSDMYRQAKEYILSDNKGKNPFYDYSLPVAILRLKQAIGRTSRFQDQESLVLLLDQRVVTKRYGKQILDGLQQVLPLHTTVRERLVEQAAAFFERN